MTTVPNTSSSRTTPAAGWDQATFRCGQCGAVRTVTTEDDYLQAVGVHRDAHELMARLNPIERDGFASILRVILSAPELGAEFLALVDQLTARPADPHDTSPEGGAA
ncbi:hypothetical protein OG426_55540 (plasmid) [Streptomyces canus]|uniref:hypothetical protein n=1 Tax=Streptomyces canus TaxID=58343 RepID=UPI002F9095F0|nr:hypothetical protein OG426_55540 [Streptomyces canus]